MATKHAQQGGKMGKKLPIFRVDGSRELWELGDEANWGELEELLKPLVSDDFWVESPEEDAFMDDVRGQFDRSENDCYGTIHNMLTSFGSDNAALMQFLLSLGVDPDLPNDTDWTPSHLCAFYARLDSAASIAACRPDMSKENNNSDTPVQAAKTTYTNDPDEVDKDELEELRSQVAIIFEELAKRGPATVAELACFEKWWAVKNLARRKVVPEEEMFERFRGKNAIEWCEHHGKKGVARELQYYFVTARALENSTNEVSPETPACASGDTQDGVDAKLIALMDEKFAQIEKKWISEKEKVVTEADEKNAALKKENATLKKKVNELDDNTAALKKENATLKKKVNQLEDDAAALEIKVDELEMENVAMEKRMRKMKEALKKAEKEVKEEFLSKADFNKYYKKLIRKSASGS